MSLYLTLQKNPIYLALLLSKILLILFGMKATTFFQPPPCKLPIFMLVQAVIMWSGELFIQFNFRFSTAITDEEIRQRTEALLQKHQLRYQLEWSLLVSLYYWGKGYLKYVIPLHYINLSLNFHQRRHFDGWFIAQMGSTSYRIRSINATIHKVNECVNAADLQQLSRIYQGVMEQLILW